MASNRTADEALERLAARWGADNLTSYTLTNVGDGWRATITRTSVYHAATPTGAVEQALADNK